MTHLFYSLSFVHNECNSIFGERLSFVVNKLQGIQKFYIKYPFFTLPPLRT